MRDETANKAETGVRRSQKGREGRGKQQQFLFGGGGAAPRTMKEEPAAGAEAFFAKPAPAEEHDPKRAARH